jgi:hypothetical protein
MKREKRAAKFEDKRGGREKREKKKNTEEKEGEKYLLPVKKWKD